MAYKDPEKRKEYFRQYYQSHKKQYYDHTKRYRDTDPQQTKVYRKRHYWKHKDSILARKKSWRNTHMDHIREYDRKHPEYGRAKRALRRSVREHYTPIDELFTRALFNNQCFNCGSADNLRIDHIRPLSKGYPLTKANACLLCASCNCSKGTKMPSEFYSPEKMEELKILLLPQQLCFFFYLFTLR